MSEACQPSIANTTPTILGSPDMSAFQAYSMVAAEHPHVTDAESDILGSAIYEGRLAAERLANPDEIVDVEEYFHLQQTAERGMSARRVMVGRHLSLVIGLSGNFAYKDRKFDEDQRADMVGVGNLALVQCMDRYVHIPGRHFTPFAKRCVTNAMISELIKNIRSSTGKSARMQGILLDVRRAHQEALKADPNADFFETAEKLGYSQERMAHILSLREVRPASWDEPVISSDPEGLKITDITGDPKAEAAIEGIENKILLSKTWETAKELRRRQIITDTEWKVFTARYVEGLTQEAIAASDWEGPRTQTGVHFAEQRALEKIKKEIENPGIHDKKIDASLQIVESAVGLLDLLEIPISRNTDLLGVASNILDNLPLTAWQREVMHALLGTTGKHYRPKELAREKGRTHRAIYDAREKAIRNILQAWDKMSTADKDHAAYTRPEMPVTLTSRGPRPNTHTGRKSA